MIINLSIIFTIFMHSLIVIRFNIRVLKAAVWLSQLLSEKPDHPRVCVRLKDGSWFCIIYSYCILIVYYIDILILYYTAILPVITNCTYKLFRLIEFLGVKRNLREGTGIVLNAGSRIILCSSNPLHTIIRYFFKITSCCTIICVWMHAMYSTTQLVHQH